MATCASIYSICIADPSWLAQQMCMKCPLIFQFHKGAIETMTKRLFRILSAAFNSIKVRLKQRLRKQLNKVFDFQFHKGAIETHRGTGGSQD